MRRLNLAGAGDERRRKRREFTTDEWIDLMVRSMGYEPSGMTRRLKLLFLLRLVPLAERNFNMVELGPKESPHAEDLH